MRRQFLGSVGGGVPSLKILPRDQVIYSFPCTCVLLGTRPSFTMFGASEGKIGGPGVSRPATIITNSSLETFTIRTWLVASVIRPCAIIGRWGQYVPWACSQGHPQSFPGQLGTTRKVLGGWDPPLQETFLLYYDSVPSWAHLITSLQEEEGVSFGCFEFG